MSTRLRVVLIIGVAFYLLILISFLKHKKLDLKYSLLWIMAGFGLLISAVFPEILGSVADFLGIQTASNALFVLAIGMIIVILMFITSIVSKQNEKITKLIQYNALLEKKIRELENGKKK